MRKNATSIRHENMGLVLRSIIAQTEGISRADIAKDTGLTRATVSRLVEELFKARIIHELEPVQPPVGRPSLPLVVQEGTYCGIGIALHSDYVSIQAYDIAGNLLFSQKTVANLRNSHPAQVFSHISDTLTEELHGKNLHILSTVLCIPGIIGEVGPTILTAPDMGWHDIDPLEHLKFPGFQREGFRIINPAHAAAYSFLYTRPGVKSEEKNFLYLTEENNVDAALFVNGQIVTGAHGWRSDIGHMCVNPSGPHCSCGSNGCLEQYAGLGTIVARSHQEPGTQVAQLSELVVAGDSRVLAAIDEAALALGCAIANVLNLLDISTVILGGNFAHLFPHMEQRLKAEIEYRLVQHRLANISISPCKYDGFAAARGGCMMALSDILKNPQMWENLFQ